MTGPADERAEHQILEALDAGPMDVLGLLRALRRQIPHLIGSHEGALHALLHGLLRSGRVALAGLSTGGLALYVEAGGGAAATEEQPEPSPVLSRSMADEALKVASGVRGPAARQVVKAHSHSMANVFVP